MKKLLTLSLIALTAFIGCKKAAEDDVFDPLKDKDNPQVETKASITTEKLYVSATEASFAWSEYNGNAEQDFGATFLAGIYSDQKCETPVIAWTWHYDIEKYTTRPAQTFTGLEPGKKYWFKVVDKNNEAFSDPVEFTTGASTVVPLGTAEVAVGGTVLHEDFSECIFGGDHVSIAYGVTCDEEPFKKPEGVDPEGFNGTAPKPVQDWRAFKYGSRIMDFAQDVDGKVFTQAGYVKIGKSDGPGRLITPVLSCLKEPATVEVSFRASAYSSGCQTPTNYHEIYVNVEVADGGLLDGNVLSAANYSNTQLVLLKDATEWGTYSAKISGVYPTSRIAIGGTTGELSHANGYARLFLDDLDIKVVSYDGYPPIEEDINIDGAFWSDAKISWDSETTYDNYKVYLNGNLVETLPSDTKSYHFTGLDMDTDYEVKLGAVSDGKEAFFTPAQFKTAGVHQLTKNVGPTSVSVAFDNCAGELTNTQIGCFQIQLFDANDANGTPIVDEYVRDAQNTFHGHPFMPSLMCGSDKPLAPTAVALGYLKADTDYWFRVRTVESYKYDSYMPNSKTSKGEKTLASINGTSEFSPLVKVSTSSKHSAGSNEILFQGFDEITLMADFVNLAVGAYPAFCPAPGAAGSLTAPFLKEWSEGWRFYPLNTQLPSSQFANIGWVSGITVSNELVSIGGGVITVPEFAKGAKVYTIKDESASVAELTDWRITNNVWPGQGFVTMGAAYKANDSALGSSAVRGMVITPALDSDLLGAEAKECTVTFKALALQGVAMKMTVGVWDGAASTEETPVWTSEDVDLYNSAGITEAADSFVAGDNHKWYEYSVTVSLKKGDRVAFATDKNGAAVLDDICITLK